MDRMKANEVKNWLLCNPDSLWLEDASLYARERQRNKCMVLDWEHANIKAIKTKSSTKKFVCLFSIRVSLRTGLTPQATHAVP